MLDATCSTDAEGDALSYRWKALRVPAGSAVTSNSLDDRDAAQPIFTPDMAGSYRFQVTVSDGSSQDTATALVTVAASTANSAPVADAGADQVVGVADTLVLDGSASSDPDGDSITHFWYLSAAPDGAAVWMSDTTTETPSFVAATMGTYELTLVVSDGMDLDIDTVEVVVDAGADRAGGGCGSGSDRGGRGLRRVRRQRHQRQRQRSS